MSSSAKHGAAMPRLELLPQPRRRESPAWKCAKIIGGYFRQVATTFAGGTTLVEGDAVVSSGPDLDTNGNVVLGRDDLDIVDPDSYLQGFPHATFKRLRDDDPISWWPEHDGGKGFWAVTRYDDLLYVSQHVELFSSAQGVTLEEIEGRRLRPAPQHAGVRPAGAHPAIAAW
jgi:hypothetical protein